MTQCCASQPVNSTIDLMFSFHSIKTMITPEQLPCVQIQVEAEPSEFEKVRSIVEVYRASCKMFTECQPYLPVISLELEQELPYQLSNDITNCPSDVDISILDLLIPKINLHGLREDDYQSMHAVLGIIIPSGNQFIADFTNAPFGYDYNRWFKRQQDYFDLYVVDGEGWLVELDNPEEASWPMICGVEGKG